MRWSASGAAAAAAAGAAWLGAAPRAALGLSALRAAPQSCPSGTQALVDQPNSWCGTMNVSTSSFVVPGCCGRSAGGSSAGGQGRAAAPSGTDGECRIAYTEAPYCDKARNPNCEVGAQDTLLLRLDLGATSATETCCSTCKCFGDPECVAFNGAKDEWIVCQGTNSTTCLINEKQCLREKDHAGRTCQWVKNTPGYESFAVSGSPCQPNYALSGYPTMLMYAADGFALELTLGERGVILATKVSMMGDDARATAFTLNAGDCFQYEPNAVGEASAGGAWVSASGQRGAPAGWVTTQQEGSVEVQWSVSDPISGVFVSLTCTKAFTAVNNGFPRINVNSVVETNPMRSGLGFCASGAIEGKSGTPAQQQQYMDTHDYCSKMNQPALMQSCAAILNTQCSRTNIDARAAYWCDYAVLSRSQSAPTPAQCLALLGPAGGSNEARVAAWVRLLCEINQLALDQCEAELQQFGWTDFLSKYSNGISGLQQSGGVPLCGTSAADYAAEGGKCEPGVRLEYMDARSGAWATALFVPNSKPPCGGVLALDGAQNPELFLNPIRVAQCGLSASCLATNGCLPSPGFETAFQFFTEDCPTARPTLAPSDAPTRRPTQQPTQQPTAQPSQKPSPRPTPKPTPQPTQQPTRSPTHFPTRSPITSPPTPEKTVGPTCFKCSSEAPTPPQQLCNGGDNGFGPMTTCESCCVADQLFAPPMQDQLCREVDVMTAFCDIYSGEGRARCQHFAALGGAMEISLVFDSGANQGDQACCRTCSCWGDPHCSSFSGQQESWVLCDARDPKSCRANQKQCLTQQDHAGNQCTWSAALAAKMPQYGYAFGSPCQPNWQLSGVPAIELFATPPGGPRFDASAAVGERAVMTAYVIKRDNLTVVLDSAQCFNLLKPGAFAEQAFQVTSPALPGQQLVYPGLLAAAGVNVSWAAGPQKNFQGVWQEVTVAIYDRDAKVFSEIACIVTGVAGGKTRLNVNAIIDGDYERVLANTGTGFCVDGQMDMGRSTVGANTATDTCDDGTTGAVDLCKALYDSSCASPQIISAVYGWCDQANVFASDPRRVNKCIDYINPTRSSQADILRKWSSLYCQSIQASRPSGMSAAKFQTFCTSKIMNEGPASLVATYGAGSVSSQAGTECGDSEDDYPPIDAKCLFGVAIEYYDEAANNWIQELFVPANKPPCLGKLLVTAKKHPMLFQHMWRYRQCDIDHHACPVTANCQPAQGYTFKFKYEYPPQVCTDNVDKLKAALDGTASGAATCRAPALATAAAAAGVALLADMRPNA